MTGISCGACKFLRRKCTSQCVFAPYFRYELAAEHFGAIHKVFGASNASRVLVGLPEQWRSEAAMAMSFEALARIQDPVYGCVTYICALQQQVAQLQQELQALLSCTTLDNNNDNNIGITNADWIIEHEDVALLTGQPQPGYGGQLDPFQIPFMTTELDVFGYLASFHAQ